jgi:trans-2,3-dihydro-3-hydroxyanthranilate isomerase
VNGECEAPAGTLLEGHAPVWRCERDVHAATVAGRRAAIGTFRRVQRRYVLLDVFTDERFSGNPLAVFTDARGLEAEVMGRIANELNLSETTFILPAEGEGDARVRIFTPRRELPFAGHPVVGTAWVVGRSVALGRLVFETGVGPIEVELERRDGQLVRAVMSQPRPRFSPAEDPEALLAALRLPYRGHALEVADNGFGHAIVPVDSLEALATLTPDIAALAALDEAVTFTVWADAGDVIRSRVFAPAAGVAEDAATGSAAGPLAAQLVRDGVRRAGRVTIVQGVELGRPSRIEVDADDAGDVRVGGACVVTGRGFLDL